MHIHHDLRGWAVLLAGLAAQTGVHAGYTASATVDTSASTSINWYYSKSTADDPAMLTQTSSNPIPMLTTQTAYTDQLGAALNTIGTANGQVTVSPGSIQISSTASGSTNINPGGGIGLAGIGASGSSFTEGKFTDSVVWQVAGLSAGTFIYLDYGVRLDGAPGVGVNNVFGTSSGGFDYQWQTQVGAGGVAASGPRFYTVASDGSVSQNSLDFGSFVTTAYVTLGAAENLSMFMRVQNYGSGSGFCENCVWVVNGAAFSTATFQPGLSWNGISGARLADGTPIQLSLLSAVSDSGFDYVSSVPESPVALLMAGGLSLLAVARRRMSSKCRS